MPATKPTERPKRSKIHVIKGTHTPPYTKRPPMPKVKPPKVSGK